MSSWYGLLHGDGGRIVRGWRTFCDRVHSESDVMFPASWQKRLLYSLHQLAKKHVNHNALFVYTRNVYHSSGHSAARCPISDTRTHIAQDIERFQDLYIWQSINIMCGIVRAEDMRTARRKFIHEPTMNPHTKDMRDMNTTGPHLYALLAATHINSSFVCVFACLFLVRHVMLKASYRIYKRDVKDDHQIMSYRAWRP